MKRYLPFFALFALALGLAGCSSETKTEAKVPETVRGVSLAVAETTKIPDAVAALGTIRAAQTSQLAAQVMGSVMAVNVREGDSVKKGQVLVVLDAVQAQAGLEQAEAALSAARNELIAANSARDLADATLKRYDMLYQRKSVSPQEYDEMKTRQASAVARADAARDGAAQAKAAVAQAQTMLGYTRIRAPFDGTVTARHVDPGAMAAPGTPLVTVEARGRYRAEVTVDESNLRFVRMGDAVPLTLDAYPGQSFTGKVVQIVPSADPQSRTFLVKVEMPSSPILRSGLSATADFSRGTRDALLVPRSAVVERGSLKAVYVVGDDQLASLRYITVGNPQKDQVEVLSGLSAREKLIANPADREFGGKRVEVQ